LSAAGRGDARRPVPAEQLRPAAAHADRPQAVATLTRIFLAEIERSLCATAGVTSAVNAPATRPRLGGISFLHRFGSVLNHHVHLHACVTDGVFMPAADEAGGAAPPVFLPARPITQTDLAAVTERVRRRVIRWFRLNRLLDAAAAAESPRGPGPTASSNSHRLSSWTGWPILSRRRGSTGIGITGCSRRITSSDGPGPREFKRN
jgi:hypothetical protein